MASEGTVKTDVKYLRCKLELKGRGQAAPFAYETGFVKAGDSQSSGYSYFP